jgi:signal transduction histidine kinase
LTARSAWSPPSARLGLGIADGGRLVPLLVTVFIVLDSVSSMVAKAYSMTGGPSGVVAATQVLLVVPAAVAVMCSRLRAAALLVGAVVALAFAVGPTGQEAYLMVIIGVTAALRADWQQLVLVVLGQLTFTVCFGFLMESLHPGWGWDGALTYFVISAASLTVGLVTRRLLRTRDLRRLRVRRLEQENAQIRAIERERLAEDLETMVTRGLATLEEDLDAAARGPSDLDGLRAGLSRVDGHSRSLLTELRTLLAVLRGDPSARSLPSPSSAGRAGRWTPGPTTQQVRIAVAAVCGLLAVRAVAGSGGVLARDEVVELFVLLACAAAVYRPVVGATCAAVTLAVAAALGATTYWVGLATSLVCLVAALRFHRRWFWLAVLVVAGFVGVLAGIDSTDRVGRVLLVWYGGFFAVLAGLVARHLLIARAESTLRLGDLTSERGRVASEERSAVARELHDVVAHQLSVTTMLVMATSLSEDREVLAATLEKVRRSTQAARHELAGLLAAMRGPGRTGQVTSAPVVTPRAEALALVSALADHGHRAVLDVDPAADGLDVTTQRTLTRVMQEAATNILRYAPPGSVCHYTLVIDETGVRLRVVSPRPVGGEHRSDLSLGWGLRGIRERVELTGGTFSAGPDRDDWVLDVHLPSVVDSGVPTVVGHEGGAKPAGIRRLRAVGGVRAP